MGCPDDVRAHRGFMISLANALPLSGNELAFRYKDTNNCRKWIVLHEQKRALWMKYVMPKSPKPVQFVKGTFEKCFLP